MTERVPADRIESIVGARRHKREHIIRGVLDEDRAYILHSEECRERYTDLRDCPWSRALDRGVAWLPPDEPVIVRVLNGRLVVHGLVPPNYRIGAAMRTDMSNFYRKKPVLIEARQLTSNTAEWHAVYQWVETNTLGSFEPLSRIEGREPWPESGVSIDPRDGRMIIATLEGGHWANHGDWIIRGVAGEFYPCRDDIFDETYEAVSSDD